MKDPTTEDFPAFMGAYYHALLREQLRRYGSDAPPMTRRQRLYWRWYDFRARVRGRIHNRLFPECHGEDYW